MIAWLIRLWTIRRLWGMIRGSRRNSPPSNYRG
jgi:hypothetical protein